MKKFLLFILLAVGRIGFAQTSGPSDTIKFDHLHLEDVLVMDQWLQKHGPKRTAHDHQLEMQLKQLKGLSLISRGTFAQEPIYRGQQDGRLQVKLNGMRIYSACTDRMDPATSYVVANNLRSAQASSSCEADCSNGGLAGNLNLELKQASFGQGQKWRWGIEQEFHTNTNGSVSSLNLEKQSGKLAWRLNGSWQQHGNYHAGDGSEVVHSQNQKQNWALNTSYRLSGKELLQLDVIYDLATDVGYPALPMDVGRAQAAIAGLTYSSHKGLGPFERMELKLYHNDIYHEMDDSRRSVVIRMDMPGRSQTTGINFNVHAWQLQKHRFSASAEYYTNNRMAEMTMHPEVGPPMYMLTWPHSRLHGMATGISDHWHLGKNSISTSLRLDYETAHIIDGAGQKQWEGMGYETEAHRRFLLPKLKTALTHKVTDRHSVMAALSYGMRAATTSELFGFYLFNAHDGFDYLGNPDLKPEELYSVEVGHTYASSKLRTSATAFVNRYHNYIFGLTSGYDAMTYRANGVRIYENIDRANFYGAELEAHYQPLKKLETFAKAEYVRGFLNEGFDLPLIPPLQASFGASLNVGKWHALVQSRVAAEQPFYNSEYGDRYTPGYVLLDVGAGYELQWKKTNFLLEISANNCFDTLYRDHLNWGGIPSIGRNIVFKLKVDS